MSTPTPPTPSPILRQRQARRFLDENTSSWDFELAYDDDTLEPRKEGHAYVLATSGRLHHFSAPTLVELAEKVSEHLGKPIT